METPPWWLRLSDARLQKISQMVREVRMERKWRSIRTSPVGERMKRDWIMVSVGGCRCVSDDSFSTLSTTLTNNVKEVRRMKIDDPMADGPKASG